MHVTVITPILVEGLIDEEQYKNLGGNGLTVSGVSLPFGPRSIESRVDDAFAVPAMIAAAQQAQKDGADALVIDCMDDPGLGALREMVDIPVLGVAQTCMAISTSLAHSFGIVTVISGGVFRDLVALYGYDRQFAGCLWVDVPVLELHERMDTVNDEVAQLALRLVREGAASIILGCTGFVGCAAVIRKTLRAEGFEVPVLDPLPTTVSFATTLVKHGLSHSRVSFPKWDAKTYQGYEFLGQR
jgi:allantoin racemase